MISQLQARVVMPSFPIRCKMVNAVAQGGTNASYTPATLVVFGSSAGQTSLATLTSLAHNLMGMFWSEVFKLKKNSQAQAVIASLLLCVSLGIFLQFRFC